jgi:hypothetical protein
MSVWVEHARGARLALGALLFVAACHKSPRCVTCGMKVDPASPWVSYVTVGGTEAAFDTPSCAFAAWRKAKTSAGPARFREYYSQELKPVEELRFVSGSDVTGPMGPELVPVRAETAGRFARDHNGAPPRTAAELVSEASP